MALELSYVNSSLQLLKEELEELNSNVDVDRPERCVHTCARMQTGPRGTYAGTQTSPKCACACKCARM